MKRLSYISVHASWRLILRPPANKDNLQRRRFVHFFEIGRRELSWTDPLQHLAFLGYSTVLLPLSPPHSLGQCVLARASVRRHLALELLRDLVRRRRAIDTSKCPSRCGAGVARHVTRVFTLSVGPFASLLAPKSCDELFGQPKVRMTGRELEPSDPGGPNSFMPQKLEEQRLESPVAHVAGRLMRSNGTNASTPSAARIS